MKVFVTGATGYIGGSIAHRLLEQGDSVIGLVRTPEQARLLQERGITPLLGSLDDADSLFKGATEADATINAANSDHYFAAQVLISTLKGSGKTLIHTSGSSIICDDAKGQMCSDEVFEDDVPFLPMLHRAPRVRIDQLVRSAGIHDGIRALVICPSMIYGNGFGLKTESDQLPKILAKSKTLGAGVYIDEGKPVWSNVYIGDLVDLYLNALEKAPSGAMFYAENGETSFRAIAEAVSFSLGFAGNTVSWPYEDAVAELGGFARVALATNARIRAVNARRLLDWNPQGPSLDEAVKNGL